MKKLLLALFAYASLTCAVSAQGIPNGGASGVPVGGCLCSINILGASPSTITAGTTSFVANGVIGVNQNFATISPHNGTFRNLYWRTAVAPGAGQSYVFTLYVGPVASMVATNVTCTISNTNTTCSDTADTATITAGQYWAIQVVTSASAAATAQQAYGIELDVQ